MTGQPLSHSLISRRLSEKGLNARRPRKNRCLPMNIGESGDGGRLITETGGKTTGIKFLFTDESKISIGNDGCTYVWRRQGEELSPECCLSTVQHPASVMLWGSMASSGVGSIHKIEGKLNATGYQEILADKMLPDAYILIGEDFILQQDNFPIHTAFTTREWLWTNDVTVLEWPSRSPDANPIEHLWHWLKVRVNRLHPRTAADLWAAVQTAWASIPVDFVQTLVDSLPRRVEAIRRANGGWTKY